MWLLTAIDLSYTFFSFRDRLWYILLFNVDGTVFRAIIRIESIVISHARTFRFLQTSRCVQDLVFLRIISSEHLELPNL